MSERSFRAQAPEAHARERRASLVDGALPPSREGSVKRKGSFSLPITLRSNSSTKKSATPGVIQPLPQQQNQKIAPTQSRKFKTTLRGDGGFKPPMSPTHSAMRLPHPPGIGSSSSSVRSFQTDLSSIAEDRPIDLSHIHPSTKQGQVLPVKSALKGGSGPPSIISEAVSEESKSSIGAHDRKGKARVSFSDEGENSPITPAIIPKTKETYLKPEVARTISPPASPPVSPKVTPSVPATVPSIVQKPAPKPVMTAEPKTTPQQSLPSPPPEKVVKTVPAPIIIPSPSTSESGHPPPKEASAAIGVVPAVTIHVPSTPTPTRQTRLPGAFPDPTPEPTPDPTPPGTSAECQTTPPPAEQNASLSPESQRELDLQRGLSLKTMNLVPVRQPGTLVPIAELTRSESQNSEVSVYSDARDELPEERKLTSPNATNAITAPTQTTTVVPAVIPAVVSVGVNTNGTNSQPPISPTTKPPAPSTPQKPTLAPITTTGTTIPLVVPLNPTLRQNGTPKSASRPQSLPPAASPSKDRKPMRMSMREGTTSADMAKGLMTVPRPERVPSDSSFKRLKPREESTMKTTMRDKPQPRRIRRRSDSSSDLDRPSGRLRSGSIFGRFKARRESIDRGDATRQEIVASSRFRDSSDEEEPLPPPPPRSQIMETESLPWSPKLRKRTSFSKFFGIRRKEPERRVTSQTVATIATVTEPVPAGPVRTDSMVTETAMGTNVDGSGHQRTRSGSIISKRTGKEKRFQGLRRLFRIKE